MINLDLGTESHIVTIRFAPPTNISVLCAGPMMISLETEIVIQATCSVTSSYNIYNIYIYVYISRDSWVCFVYCCAAL